MTSLRTANPAVDTALKEIASLIGPSKVRQDRVARSLYSRDASTVDSGSAGAVCFAESSQDVQHIMRVALRHGQHVVPRGAGTGLAGGAVPLDGAIVLSLARMNRIQRVEPDDRIAWVEPGVVNLSLTKRLEQFGVHFAPDPSSQQVCTIGGNVATNAGGPHCLAYGVTSAHVLAVEVVLPTGELVMLGGVEGGSRGLDLRGGFVGSEGTMGIATLVGVALTDNPPAVATILIAYDSVRAAANTVSQIIASGMVPAAIEAMDRTSLEAIENFVHAGYPTDVEAALLIDVDGHSLSVKRDAQLIEEVARTCGAIKVRVAQSDSERQLLWKGRKSAFGATAQIAPKYYLHDTVVPRSKLADVLEEVYQVAERHQTQVMNVFHAGDGNLHPLLLFDPSDQEAVERVHAAADEIVRASLAAGGVLSGEHGIGLEKQAFMGDLFSSDDLDQQDRLRRAFDPQHIANPGKVLPTTRRQAASSSTREAVLDGFARDVGSTDRVAVEGHRTRWLRGGSPVPATRLLKAPKGIVSFVPDEMVVRVRAGTSVEELHSEVAKGGQRTALPERGGTVGGALAIGEDHISVLGRGRMRSAVLQLRYVSDEGLLVTTGGPTVKNVSGYDLTRVMVGSLGTLGLLAEATIRTNPIPEVSGWWRVDGVDPFRIQAYIYRPAAVLFDGELAWVQIEGHSEAVAEHTRVLSEVASIEEVDGPPPIPAHRWLLTPSALQRIDSARVGSYVASIGTGVLFADRPAPAQSQSDELVALTLRAKAAFDPRNRLNPGRDPASP